MTILNLLNSKDAPPETMNVTPQWISELKDDEIFVFGCRRPERHYESAWDYDDIAPLFRSASKLPNVWLPKEFWNDLYK